MDEDRPTPCAGVALQVNRKGHECLGHRQRIDLGREAAIFDDPNTLAEQDRMDFRVVLLVPPPYPPVVHAQATYLPLDKPARGFRRRRQSRRNFPMKSKNGSRASRGRA